MNRTEGTASSTEYAAAYGTAAIRTNHFHTDGATMEVGGSPAAAGMTASNGISSGAAMSDGEHASSISASSHIADTAGAASASASNSGRSQDRIDGDCNNGDSGTRDAAADRDAAELSLYLTLWKPTGKDDG